MHLDEKPHSLLCRHQNHTWPSVYIIVYMWTSYYQGFPYWIVKIKYEFIIIKTYIEFFTMMEVIFLENGLQKHLFG